MLYYSGVIAVAKSLLVATGIVVCMASSVLAQSPSDNIEVMVCPASNESSFAVAEPQSDSVVNEPKVVVKGGVEYISQIDFFIDDTYNHTIALGRSAADFESVITLSPGTHTVQFVATDSCSQTTHTASIVMTYQPKTQPSIGESVETVVDGRVTNVREIPELQPDENMAEKIIDSIIVPPFKIFAESLDLVNPAQANAAMRPADVARATLFISGVALVATASYLGTLAVLPSQFVFIARYRRGVLGVVLMVGVALISVVFML